MTMLYSSQGTITFPIAAGNTLVVNNLSGVETVTGSTVAREDASAVLGTNRYGYGPQTAAATITLSTTGQCDYEIRVGDVTPSRDLVKVDPVTGGVDASSMAALGASGLSGSKSSGLVALIFGDSLSANGFNVNDQTTGQNWVLAADMELGGVFKRVVNGGVSGTRTDAQLAALPGYLAATAFDIAIVGPNSVNDIDPTKGTVFTSAQTIANYDAAISMCFAQPTMKQVWLCTVHRPSSTNVGAATAAGNATRRWYDDLDAYVRRKAQADSRIKVIEFGRAVTNAAGNGLRTNYNQLASDATHIGYLGSRECGNTAVKPVMQQLPFTPWSMPRFAADYRNLAGPHTVAPQGAYASGAGGASLGTGATGTTLPGGVYARRNSGDGATTMANVASIASPVGLDSQCAQMDVSIGVDTGGCGFSFGTESSAKNRYDNTRANSTPYTWGERINLSPTLCCQVFTPGTSAASAPDFTGAAPGDFITDGGVTWLVTEIPQFGDKLLFEVDMTILAVTAGAKGGFNPYVWINFVDSSSNQTSSYINFSAAGNTVAWPAATGRRLLRHVITVPTTAGAGVRIISILTGVQGASGATGTIQMHGVSMRKYVG